jgi:hypothetical protein
MPKMPAKKAGQRADANQQHGQFDHSAASSPAMASARFSHLRGERCHRKRS